MVNGLERAVPRVSNSFLTSYESREAIAPSSPDERVLFDCMHVYQKIVNTLPFHRLSMPILHGILTSETREYLRCPLVVLTLLCDYRSEWTPAARFDSMDPFTEFVDCDRL